MALPDPAAGLVISYDYLWKDQAEAGETSGRKTRPCAVVLAIRQVEGGFRTYVAPVTHSDPSDPTAVLIPASVKRRLGLDDKPSWIVTDQLNDFVWPGFDLRPISRNQPDTFAWGFLPEELVAAVRVGIATNRKRRQFSTVPRD